MEPSRLARQLGMALIAWSITSIVIGIVLLLAPISVLHGIGLQALLWGIIDAVIAVVGVFRNQEQSADKAARFLRITPLLDQGLTWIRALNTLMSRETRSSIKSEFSN